MFVAEVTQNKLLDVVSTAIVLRLESRNVTFIFFSFFFIHLIKMINIFTALPNFLHFINEVWLIDLMFVEEVFDGTKLCRSPRILFAEEGGPLDRLVTKIVIFLLDLINQVLFKHRIYLVILPSEILAPKNQCVDIVVAYPT